MAGMEQMDHGLGGTGLLLGLRQPLGQAQTEGGARRLEAANPEDQAGAVVAAVGDDRAAGRVAEISASRPYTS
ncbi:hypothetical protein GCM10010211_37230 [Streptomyces albospinus]|uniref:Uncharacterized protein n=1 Tax=Streptomyces albospinus TaxID=285515 RepID=A0ABQ2V4I2_9ACTN|nr:hypothetical protein GCM10010211_37230 [Streptomyces albospinus]